MTNKEAIIKLTNIMHDDHYSWSPAILTAFRMAVDALKGAEAQSTQTNTPNTLNALDCISRAEAIDRIESHIRTGDELYPLTDADKILNHAFEIAASCVYNMPSAQPERTGRCIWCDGIEDRRLRIEFYWIDDDGNTASFSEPHMVATGIAKYCPECGRKLKMEVEHDNA